MSSTIFRIPGLPRHGCSLSINRDTEPGVVTRCGCGRYYRNEVDSSLYASGHVRQPRWRRVYCLSWPLFRRNPARLHWDASKATAMCRASAVNGGTMAIHIAFSPEAGMAPILTTDNGGYVLTPENVEWLTGELQNVLRVVRREDQR